MSVRMRVTGEILCGAKSEPMPDDTYVPDGLHYHLSVIQRVLVPDEDEATTGHWHWRRKGEPFRTLRGDADVPDPVNEFGWTPPD